MWGEWDIYSQPYYPDNEYWLGVPWMGMRPGVYLSWSFSMSGIHNSRTIFIAIMLIFLYWVRNMLSSLLNSTIQKVVVLKYNS